MSLVDDQANLPTIANAESLSERLIAELLEEELSLLKSAQEAERLTLIDACQFTMTTNNTTTAHTISESDFSTDEQLALELCLADLRTAKDSEYARSVQMAQATAVADGQVALKFAATETNLSLDYEFARKLQASDRYRDSDDAEVVLGKTAIDIVIASNPNGKGKHKKSPEEAAKPYGKTKGKGKSEPLEDSESLEGHDNDETMVVDTESQRTLLSEAKSLQPLCGICMDSTMVSSSPHTAATQAGGSSSTTPGIRLSCLGGHVYCLNCFSQYVLNDIDPMGNGRGNPEQLVFPIACPECPLEDCPGGITDDDAVRALSEGALELWFQQRRFDAVRRIWCPNKACVSMIEAPRDDSVTRLDCRVCGQEMCAQCRVRWHENITCDAYQALPADERSPEDRLVLELARSQKWRRCPACKIIVSLTVGCNHMVCRCGTHFCFKCGAHADRKTGKCLRTDPPCDLWDEEMLLAEEERAREAEVVPQDAPVPQAQVLDWGAWAVEAATQGPRGLGLQPEDADNWDPSDSEADSEPLDFTDWPGSAEVAPQDLPPPRLGAQTRRSVNPGPSGPSRVNDIFDWMEDLNPQARRHRFTRDMQRTFQCGYCLAQMRSLYGLRRHLQSVRKHEVFACCGRFFPSEQSLEQHRSTLSWADHEDYSNNREHRSK